MEAKGVRFLTHTEVGKDYSAASLLKNFDAVVLCCGATKPRNLPIEGRELRGVHFAMEYLHANTSTFLSGSHSGIDYISAQDKDVIVIGGGDTGTDCVGTAMRQRCRSLAQFEILPRPPDKRAPDNPWPEWPKVYRMDYAQEEACAVFGKDPRSFSIVTKRLEGDSNGQVKEVHTVGVQWSQTNGRWASQEIPGTERVWQAQLVLLALGFLGPEDQLLQQLGVERDDRSNARAEYGSYFTSIPGVFAAGDIRRGQSLVVWAINEGREAARECDRYLMGRTELP
jgi:glutamate synthase (NADPH/NADH) small chain